MFVTGIAELALRVLEGPEPTPVSSAAPTGTVLSIVGLLITGFFSTLGIYFYTHQRRTRANADQSRSRPDQDASAAVEERNYSIKGLVEQAKLVGKLSQQVEQYQSERAQFKQQMADAVADALRDQRTQFDKELNAMKQKYEDEIAKISSDYEARIKELTDELAHYKTDVTPGPATA